MDDEFEYSIVLPGELMSTNADTTKGDTLFWYYSVEDFLRHICLLTDKRMPTIRIPNTIALLAGQTNGYVNRFIGRDTWFTASSLRTLWSNSGISSVLAEKALNFTSRPWQSSITDQLDDLYRSF